MSPNTAIITLTVGTTHDGLVSLTVVSEHAKDLSDAQASVFGALMETIQGFCDLNQFPINLRRRLQ